MVDQIVSLEAAEGRVAETSDEQYLTISLLALVADE